jgi:arginine deiminase
MDDDERIKKLEARVDSLWKENFRLKKAQKDQHKHIKILPRDVWYVRYLMDSLKELEQVNAEQEKVIHTYQKHYAKWGHFYTDWELSTGKKEEKKEHDILE